MDNLWWNQIPNARRMISDTVSKAHRGGSVLLTLPPEMPWKQTFRKIAQQELLAGDPNNALEVIQLPETEDVGQYFAQTYCSQEKLATYRKNISYAEFLGQSTDIPFHDRIFWMTDTPETAAEDLFRFVSDYLASVTKGVRPAVFVIETDNPNLQVELKKGISALDYNSYITSFDKYVFSAIAAANVPCSNCLRPYLAELIATICGNDIELAAMAAKQKDQIMIHPQKTIGKIHKQERRSDGQTFDLEKIEKILWDRVWEAQIKVVFPAIEKFLCEFAIGHKEDIERCLPYVRYGTNITVRAADQAELSDLTRLYLDGKLAISQTDFDRLEMLRRARNNLAHMQAIGYRGVCDILSL